MLRIKDFNTAYWGFIRTATSPYPFSEKVNAFIGPSGSGKTTLMDALRIILGDAKFENNRSMDHYIKKPSNWAVVRVGFWNRELEKRPFATLGFIEDEVTVCVRLDRSNGVECKREYYLFDGPFDNIFELGRNSKAYQSRQIKYTDYLQKLETVGLTPSFRRLMVMRPEDVQNVVNLYPHQLFQLIFELKGQKRIQDEHEKAQEKLLELITLEHQTIKELDQAEEKLSEYEKKKELYDENEDKKKKYKKLLGLLLKRRYWDSYNELKNQKQALLQETNKLNIYEEQHIYLEKELELLRTNLETELTREKKLKSEFKNSGEKHTEKVRDHTLVDEKYKTISEKIDELLEIQVESISGLEEELKKIEHLYVASNTDLMLLNNQLNKLQDTLTNLKKGNNVFPTWVQSYREALRKNNIPSIILADCISVREGYEPWIAAIEAYLGRERYRIIVEPQYQLAAKKLQEQFEYGARLSSPRKAQTGVNGAKVDGSYISLRGSIEVEHKNEVGGYLEHLNNIYLVKTVEEGHELQQQGYTSLTLKGLMQDKEGSLFYKTKELICGRLARERYQQNVEGQLSIIIEERDICNSKKTEYGKIKNEISKRLEYQRKRLDLPELLEEQQNLSQSLQKHKNDLKEAANLYKNLEEKLNKIQESLRTMTGTVERKNSELNVHLDLITATEGSITGYKGNIGKCELAKKNAINSLIEAGYDEHSISFIEVEVVKEEIFKREDGAEWTGEVLQSKVNELKNDLEVFSRTHKDEITQGIIAMVEPQKGRVSHLRATLNSAREDREEWEKRLASAELALRNHVRETMDQYIEQFWSMATLLGANTEGKFEQEGSNFSQWRIQLKIGFDGKAVKQYNDPEFSSGQRAAISIMLLLAAVSNQQEGANNSLMFLDEPTARVDDFRANEIGTVLQKSNVQYFITHQISASLNSVDWINHAIITSKIRAGQDYADDPIFETRRDQ